MSAPTRAPCCCCCCLSLCCCGSCSKNRLTPRGDEDAWAQHAKGGHGCEMQSPATVTMKNSFDEKRRIATKDAGDMSRPPATLLEAAARKVLENLKSLAAATDYDLFVSGGGLSRRNTGGGADGGGTSRRGRMLVPTAPRKFAECWVKAVHQADTKWMFQVRRRRADGHIAAPGRAPPRAPARGSPEVC